MPNIGKKHHERETNIVSVIVSLWKKLFRSVIRMNGPPEKKNKDKSANAITLSIVMKFYFFHFPLGTDKLSIISNTGPNCNCDDYLTFYPLAYAIFFLHTTVVAYHALCHLESGCRH